MNDNNIANQIDRLLDVGLKYQEATGKKFDYKSILKKTYTMLDENGSNVPEEIRKDIKKRIKKRILDRHFQSKTKNKSNLIAKGDDSYTSSASYDDPRDKDFYGYTDSYRGAVLEGCIGVAVSFIPGFQGVGAAIIAHSLWRSYDETINYLTRDSGREREIRDNQSNGRNSERKRNMSRRD